MTNLNLVNNKITIYSIIEIICLLLLFCDIWWDSIFIRNRKIGLIILFFIIFILPVVISLGYIDEERSFCKIRLPYSWVGLFIFTKIRLLAFIWHVLILEWIYSILLFFQANCVFEESNNNLKIGLAKCIFTLFKIFSILFKRRS